MRDTSKSKVRVLAASPSNSNKLVVLNTLVLLGGLVVLIISIKSMSGF